MYTRPLALRLFVRVRLGVQGAVARRPDVEPHPRLPPSRRRGVVPTGLRSATALRREPRPDGVRDARRPQRDRRLPAAVRRQAMELLQRLARSRLHARSQRRYDTKLQRSKQLERQWLRAGLALHHATTRHPSRVLTGAVWP